VHRRGLGERGLVSRPPMGAMSTCKDGEPARDPPSLWHGAGLIRAVKDRERGTKSVVIEPGVDLLPVPFQQAPEPRILPERVPAGVHPQRVDAQ